MDGWAGWGEGGGAEAGMARGRLGLPVRNPVARLLPDAGAGPVLRVVAALLPSAAAAPACTDAALPAPDAAAPCPLRSAQS